MEINDKRNRQLGRGLGEIAVGSVVQGAHSGELFYVIGDGEKVRLVNLSDSELEDRVQTQPFIVLDHELVIHGARRE